MGFIRQLSHNLTKSPLRIPLMMYRHRGLKEKDVFIASYPRSGNTWMRFLLYEILSKDSADFDNVMRFVPEIGSQHGGLEILPDGGRLIKTHESYRDEYKRAIYIVRDVRDVVLSEYAYQLMRGVYHNEFDIFVEDFIHNRINGYGFWDDHIRGWLSAIDQGDVDAVVIRYEDLRSNTVDLVTQVLEFLKVEVGRDEIELGVRNNTLRRMQRKEDLSQGALEKERTDIRFIREGSVQGWKDQLTLEQVNKLERAAEYGLEAMGYE